MGTIENTYALYGVALPDLEAARCAVESALGIELQLHESDYHGLYYGLGGAGGECFMLQHNFLEDGQDWLVPESPESTFLLSVNETTRADEICRALEKIESIRLLRHTVFSEELKKKEEMSFDMYGIALPDMEAARRAVESALGIALEPDDNGYYDRECCRMGELGGENFILQRNFLETEQDWMEPEAPESTFLLYVNDTPRSDEIRGALAELGSIRLLRHIVV